MVRLCTPNKNLDVAKTQTSQPSLLDDLSKTFDTLHEIFDDMGLSPSNRDQREASVYAAVNTVLQKQLSLINEEKKHMAEKCQSLITEIKQMEISLDENKSECRDANDETVTKPLIKCLRGLQEKRDNLKKRHDERYASVRNLAQALEQYASRLEPNIIQIELPPTNNDPASIAAFDLSQSYYKRLETEYGRVYQEYNKRVSVVRSIARDIVQLYCELGTADSQTDQAVIEHGASNPERLGLKIEDIEQLRAKKEKLLDEREGRQTRVDDLKQEIEELWRLLDVEIGEQHTFLSQNRGCSLKTIRELENELDRLQDLKQEHLHVFILEARERLVALWEKLYFSEEEMHYFAPAHSEDYSDTLLAAHEKELRRLQAIYEERTPVITLIDKHRVLISEREDLAAAAADASRLITRGSTGNRDPSRLLREEKMRKRIAKELPRIEGELRLVLERWEDEYGEPFLVKGEDYLQTLNNTSTTPAIASQPRAGALSRQQSAPTPTARARANTASSIPGGISRSISRPTSTSNTAQKPAPRPKTPSARPKTPSAQPLRSKTPTTDRPPSTMGTSTIGRSGGRTLAQSHARDAATLHRSGAKTPGPYGRQQPTLHKSPSKTQLRTPLPSFTTDNSTTIDRSKSLTQTLGRFPSNKARKALPHSTTLMMPPKMASLSRQGSKDCQLSRARSEVSIRSVSPEDRPFGMVGGGGAAPYISASQRELSEDGSGGSMRSRQFSITSSTTLTSGSGSENWETFAGSECGGDDAAEERVDPREAYWKNKLGEQKGGKGGGGVVMVRGEDAWLGEEY